MSMLAFEFQLQNIHKQCAQLCFQQFTKHVRFFRNSAILQPTEHILHSPSTARAGHFLSPGHSSISWPSAQHVRDSQTPSLSHRAETCNGSLCFKAAFFPCSCHSWWFNSAESSSAPFENGQHHHRVSGSHSDTVSASPTTCSFVHDAE